jgi:hypothetical protein
VDNFDAIVVRYKARCQLNGRRCTDSSLRRCFSPLRFQLGNLNPAWSKYVASVPRILGKRWRNRFETLLFDLNDDKNLMYRYSSTVGTLVEQFLGNDC